MIHICWTLVQVYYCNQPQTLMSCGFWMGFFTQPNPSPPPPLPPQCSIHESEFALRPFQLWWPPLNCSWSPGSLLLSAWYCSICKAQNTHRSLKDIWKSKHWVSINLSWGHIYYITTLYFSFNILYQISEKNAVLTFWRPGLSARVPIKLLESPIPTATPPAPPSQKAHFDDISGTKRGTIDPLVSKRPEKNSE